MNVIDGSITSALGFMAAATASGLKADHKKDIALIVCKDGASCAGVYTANQVKGHSLKRSMRLIEAKGHCKALIINSGNANACIGEQGDLDALEISKQVAFQLEIEADEVLPASTGVIGQALPMEKIRPAIAVLCRDLSSSEEAGRAAAQAIMTTDLTPKECMVRCESADGSFHVAGMAKGSGMIHPNMATMIAVLSTDAAVAPALLKELLREKVQQSFNRISVDGDMSVCDMTLILASGKSGVEITSPSHPAWGELAAGVDAICRALSKRIVADGEGATKVIDIQVEGAATAEDAYQAALAVARSPLCKTAFFGEDANWGRVLTAIGYSAASIDPDQVDIHLGQVQVCAKGLALPFSEEEAKAVLREKEICVRINLHLGAYNDHYWTCDFSYDYVRINGSYRN